MEPATAGLIEIALDPERLEEGEAEERAAFGLFTIRAGAAYLTEGYDSYIGAVRKGPLVSGYHAAEWFVWNWWRLMYEPDSSRSTDGWRAHTMNAIGEGYVWPNIAFRSDGVRLVILSERSANPEAKPFRYLGAHPWLGPIQALTVAIDDFVPRVLARLGEQGVRHTNLTHLWDDLRAERQDPDLAERRKLEALLGQDAGDASGDVIQALLDDRATLGTAAVGELAADGAGDSPMTAVRLRDIAMRQGIDARRADALGSEPEELATVRAFPEAWQQGRALARLLRQRLGLATGPVGDTRLAELTGVSRVGTGDGSVPFSFLLDGTAGSSRVAVRSRYPEGARFDLARLLCDNLLFGAGTPMLPATRAYTFRQRAQRSFAAEFLAPLADVRERLDGDYSRDAVEEVARAFIVSPLTVETLLRNNGLIGRNAIPEAGGDPVLDAA